MTEHDWFAAHDISIDDKQKKFVPIHCICEPTLELFKPQPEVFPNQKTYGLIQDNPEHVIL